MFLSLSWLPRIPRRTAPRGTPIGRIPAPSRPSRASSFEQTVLRKLSGLRVPAFALCWVACSAEGTSTTGGTLAASSGDTAALGSGGAGTTGLGMGGTVAASSMGGSGQSSTTGAGGAVTGVATAGGSVNDTGVGGMGGASMADGGAGIGGSMGGMSAQASTSSGSGAVGGMGGSGGLPDGSIPLGNDPIPSAGCGQPQGITSGFKTISNEGQDREYVIDIPDNYDPNTPYRFFYVSHWASGDARSMANNDYYDIKTEANAANEPAIFVAPSGIGGFWGEEDHPLFDKILAHVEENLCIDTTRVFAIGYSFGGMISYSLSRNHQDKLRAVVGIAPANWNIWMPETTNEPIAWLQIHGLQDETCLWVNNDSRREGGKYIVLEKAADNGCDIPGDDDFPVWQSGPHFCYEFEGCDEGYPVKICTNNGTHSAAERYTDPGESDSWVPPTAWEFFTRF